MRQRPFRPSRRDLLAGFGSATAALSLCMASPAHGQTAATMALRLGPRQAALRDQGPASPIWDFSGDLPRLTQGDNLDLTLANDLPVPVALNWRGGNELAALEPVKPLPPGQSSTLRLPSLSAGTMLCDARLYGDGQSRPLPALAFAVAERKPPEVDADHLVVIADWRVAPDGRALAPGSDSGDAATVFTINGQPTLDLSIRTNARLRFRFINACQRSAIAIKIEEHPLRVMAIDGQPADPFIARGGLLLAPGSRLDVFVDAIGQPGSTAAIQMHDGTAVRGIGRLNYEATKPPRAAPLGDPTPLPGSGLPERIPLGGAQRLDLALGIGPDSSSNGWRRAIDAITTLSPSFRARRGSTVMLNLTNPTTSAITFHIHGHYLRWLDRLDDGWKPFWLDTALLQGGQSMRVAFVAEHVGAWLMEAMATDWAAPRLARWYVVE